MRRSPLSEEAKAAQAESRKLARKSSRANSAAQDEKKGAKVFAETGDAVRAAAVSLGGELIRVAMPDPAIWRHKVECDEFKEAYRRRQCAPGCGILSRVPGLEGEMRCGAKLTDLKGVTKPFFCDECLAKPEIQTIDHH